MTKTLRKGWEKDGVGYIPLTQGYVAKVDVEDLAELTQFNWYARWSVFTQSYYAQRTDLSGEKPKTVQMHRVLLGITDPKQQVDHRDHDTLENRKFNLRIGTSKQNCHNRRRGAANTSGFKGVSFDSRRHKFVSQINFDGKVRHLGAFETPEEAHQVYVEEASRLDPEFSYAG